MTFRFLSPALIELTEAAEYYEERAPGLGADLIDEADAAIARALMFPEAWAGFQKITGIAIFADFLTRLSTLRIPMKKYSSFRCSIRVGSRSHGDATSSSRAYKTRMRRPRLASLNRSAKIMQVTIGKILAMLIALSYLAAMIFADGLDIHVAKGILGLLLPLALIWFPEQLGSFTGYVGRGGNIQTETPSILVSVMGWMILIGLPGLIYLLTKS